MSKIGSFNKAADGNISGTLHTLQGSREIVFQRIEKTSEKAPSFTAMLPGTEIVIGAGWLKAAKESGNPYVSIMMDDPTLPMPLYTRLVKDKDGDGYSLYWERTKDNSSSHNVEPSEPAPEI